MDRADAPREAAADEGVRDHADGQPPPQGRDHGLRRDRLPPAAREGLERGKADPGPDTRDREATAKALLESLRHFGVEARLLGTVSGPHVSRYELQLAPGTKVSKVAQLRDDLAYALASTDIRILAPIPGKKAVGVEVPNQRRRLVRLGDIYGRPRGTSPLLSWLGKDVSGQAVSADLALMPHVLVAGTTGSGKSGCINAILTSILMHSSPNEVRMVLVDPKRVELNHYERLPHLLTPVVTNPRLAANVLANLIGEMESRYSVMSEARARNLVELNRARKRAGEPPLPHILCVIDELADLMMVAPAEVEDSIIRLAQKARAIGIHLVLATQRPSTDVITGTIKVNIPSRIAFAVASQVDSRVILDQGGAETLLGQGDMLFRPVGTSKLSRIQGAFVTEEEIARVCGHWATRESPSSTRSCSRRRSPRSARARGRVLARPGRPARRRGPNRRRVRERLGLDDPAPPARRLHPRGQVDRHARAARHHLRVRGLQATPGPRLTGRASATARPARRWSRRCRCRRRDRHRDRARTGRELAPRQYGRDVWRASGRDADRQRASGRAAARRPGHAHGRGADEDPDQVPARARGRGLGSASERRVREGFLRTYAQLLGLDAEALVDEFRRQVEPGRGTSIYPLGDQVLESRRRPAPAPAARASGC